MAKIDIMKGIAPKSQQLNADDLLTGPRTIKITKLCAGTEEQPWVISFEGDGGRPWKPGKTPRRCLVSIWGDDPDKWIGLSLTLFCDPNVTFGKVAVGGIRISHMEGLSKPRTLMLTTTKGKKAGVTIQPLVVEKAQSKADKFRTALYAVAENPEKSVEEAWSKVDDEMKSELGTDLLDQLLAIEAAAQEHRANDPQAAVDALNESLG